MSNLWSDKLIGSDRIAHSSDPIRILYFLHWVNVWFKRHTRKNLTFCMINCIINRTYQLNCHRNISFILFSSYACREWHVSGWNVSKRFVSFRVRFVSVNFLKRVKGWHETFDPCQLVTRNDWHVSNLDTTRKIRVDTRVKRVKCNVKTLFSSMVLYWS